MNKNNCCLLIGNSRWHWAIKNLQKWEFFHTSSNPKEISFLKKRLLKWAAVGSIPKDIALDPTKQIKLQDIPLLKAPQWLGIDRALGGWGAFQKAKSQGLHSKGILMADAGTILSLTRITSKGEFAGGQLVAGLNLQRQAMIEKTHNLHKPENNSLSTNMFPRSTEAAILRGTFQSLLGTIIEAQKSTKMPVWICGGDSQIIFTDLQKKIDITYCPNIVLETMIEINLSSSL